jgi:hypothetical protein
MLSRDDLGPRTWRGFLFCMLSRGFGSSRTRDITVIFIGTMTTDNITVRRLYTIRILSTIRGFM